MMQLRHLELGDHPDAWRALGFAPDDRGRVVLARTVISLTGRGGGVSGWWIEGVDVPLDGLACAHPVPTQAPDGAPEHPNGIVSIDHVVVHTGDTRRTVAAFEDVGLELRRVRTAEGHGAPMRQCFLWAGDVILEVVGPDDAAATAEPARLLGLALVSPDLDATVAVLGPRMGAPRDAVQQGRRIAGFRTGELGVSLSLAVMSPHRG
jgi:hypothetical protein